MNNYVCLTLARDDGKFSTLPAAAAKVVLKVVTAVSLRLTTFFGPFYIAPIVHCDIS